MAEATPDLANVDFAGVTPAEFRALVKSLSAKEIAELARGELRARVLAEIFGRMGQQFRPENAGLLTAVIRWEITGESTEVWETAIAEGACTVTRGRSEAEPRVTFTLNDAEFLNLVSGNGNPVTMFMMRKVKVAGDIGLASGLTRLFDLPKG